MYLTIKGKTIKVIGDVHLGKRFTNGVPLHRRGERENLVFKQFVDEITNIEEASVVIQAADLFNGLSIPHRLLLDAVDAVVEAAIANSSALYIFNRGNHDASRDTAVSSSYDLFARLIRGSPVDNVFVATDDFDFVDHLYPDGAELSFGVCPWHPFNSVEQQLEGVFKRLSLITTHADFDTLPLARLGAMTDLVVNGHEHKPSEHETPNLKVINCGSMQPYAFGESLEQGEERSPQYHTLTVGQATELAPMLADAVVRLKVAPGEEVPVGLEPLQLVLQRVKDDGTEEMSVEFEAFDMDMLFVDAMREAGLSDDLSDVVGEYKKMRESQG